MKAGLNIGGVKRPPGVLFLPAFVIGTANAIDENFHDVGGKEGINLNEALETGGIELGESGSFTCHDGGAAGRLIDDGHLTDDVAANGLGDNVCFDHDLQLAGEDDVHGIASVPGLEKYFTGRKLHRTGFVGEKFGWIHK